jgi:aspartate/methionine/tyrosine aminotransferase
VDKEYKAMTLNPLAVQLNETIESRTPPIFSMLSGIGKALFFPKGIISQGAEAKEKAHRINATIGIAKEGGRTMAFETVTDFIGDIPPRDSLTYASSYGIPALRALWRKTLIEKNPSLAGKSFSLPVVTNGITHGISTLADVWADPGDTIIAPDMMWGNYNMIFGVKRGAHFIHYPFFGSNGGFNLDGFKQALREGATANKKIIVILNFPHNPTGYTVSKDEGKAMVDILTAEAERGTHIIAACDDAYFGLFFEEETLKESLFAQLCNCHPRLLAVKLDGATKENYVWGLRVGFITYGSLFEDEAEPVYEALEKKTAGCIRGTISNASHVGQSIVLKSMQDKRYADEKAEKFDVLKKRAERVKTVLSDPKYLDGFNAYPFNSGYFMCIRLKTVDAETLRRHLIDKYQVGLISLGKTDLRVAFSCLEESEVSDLFDTILLGIKELENA